MRSIANLLVLSAGVATSRALKWAETLELAPGLSWTEGVAENVEIGYREAYNVLRVDLDEPTLEVRPLIEV